MNLTSSNKPIVLITMDWFDPAFKAGGPIQSIVNMVGHLQTTASFYIVCSNLDVDGTRLADVPVNQWVSYGEDAWVWYCDTRPSVFLYRKLSNELHPDLLFVIGLFSPFFNWLPMISVQCDRKIWSVRGMLHPGALRMKSTKKQWFLSLIRLMRIESRIEFHATDDVEADYIRTNISPNAKIFVAANFPKKWMPLPPAEKQSGALRLLSVALISPMKNHLLVLEALAHCRGQVEYHIVGSVKDAGYWARCLACKQQLPPNIQVIHHGEVQPALVLNYLQQVHVSILPSESENYGHALIESLITGRPIITSFNTPWTGLQEYNAGANTELNINSICESIQYFIRLDQKAYNQASSAAIAYAKTKIEAMDLQASYRNMFNLPA